MDAARLVVDYLNSVGVGATAYHEVPRDRQTGEPTGLPFAVVEQTGGRAENPVQLELSVDVDCWAGTRRAAAVLAEAVSDAVLAMPDRLDDVFHAEVTTTYNNPDPDSGTPRTTVGVDFTYNA